VQLNGVWRYTALAVGKIKEPDAAYPHVRMGVFETSLYPVVLIELVARRSDPRQERTVCAGAVGGRNLRDHRVLTVGQYQVKIAIRLLLVPQERHVKCVDRALYGSSTTIRWQSAGVRQIATSSRVRLVDVDQAFQQSGECAQLTVRRDGSNDYLHPNDAGNTLIAQTVAAVVNLVIGIDHSAGIPGSSATITGSNVEPQATVSVVWDCPTDACTGGTVIGTGTADASGKVTIPVTIPASATPGTQHVIGVMAQDTGAFGTLGFSLPQVTVVTDHSSGPPGSTATITGSNYGANETVTAYFDCSAAPCTGKTAIGAASTAADGSLTLPVVIPSAATAGMTYSIGVLGGSSNGFGTVSYVVKSAPTAATVTRLSIRRTGSGLLLSWQLARPAAVIGFNLYGGARRLNAHMIPSHVGRRYHFVTGRSGASRYVLEVLLKNGKHIDVRFPAMR